MWNDEIVEETRQWREEYAARFDHDLEAIVRDLQEQQKQSLQEIIRLTQETSPAQSKPQESERSLVNK